MMVVEVMGRHAGWIAIYAGIAGGADAILVPGDPLRHRRGREAHRARATRPGARFSIVVVAEGAEPGRRRGDGRSAGSTSSGSSAWAGSATGSPPEIERLTGIREPA